METGVRNGTFGRTEEPPRCLEPALCLYEPISDLMGLCEALIQRSLKTGRPAVDQVLADLPIGGKRLRPILLLLFAAMGCARKERVVKLAAGMELLHWATLIHDDIIDQSDTRRGQPALHCRWGEHASVIVGDFLLARAYDFFSACGVSACRTADTLVKAMCEGELMQITSGYHPERTEEDYFDCIEKKTASFLSTACLMGAEAGGLAPYLRNAAARFGLALGMCYQIQDDVEDFCECIKAVGPNVINRGNDVAQGLTTLPLIHFYHSRQGPDRPPRRNCELPMESDQAYWRALGTAVVKNGSLSYARKAAECFLEKARETMVLFPVGTPKDALCNLVNALCEPQNMRKG